MYIHSTDANMQHAHHACYIYLPTRGRRARLHLKTAAHLVQSMYQRSQSLLTAMKPEVLRRLDGSKRRHLQY